MGVGGRQELKKFSKKDVFLVFRGTKTNFITLGLPRKLLEKSTSSPLDKIPPTLIHISM